MTFPRERFEDLLDLHVEDALKGIEREEFDRLLAENPDWAEEARQERQLVRMMKETPRVSAPKGLLAAAREKAFSAPTGAAVIPIAPALKADRSRPGVLWAAAAAAVVVLGAGIGYLALKPDARDSADQQMVAMGGSARSAPEAPSPAAEAKDQDINDDFDGVASGVALSSQPAGGSAEMAAAPVGEAFFALSDAASPAPPPAGDGASIQFGALHGEPLASEEAKDLLAKEDRKLVVDTNDYFVANAYFEGQPADEIARKLAPEPSFSNSEFDHDFDTRFMVVQVPREESPDYGLLQNEGRALIARTPGDVSSDSTNVLLAYRSEPDANLDGAEAEGSRLRDGALAEKAGVAQLAFASFDDLYARMKTEGGRFLFYTPDRVLAFAKEPAEATILADKLSAAAPKKEARQSLALRRATDPSKEKVAGVAEFAAKPMSTPSPVPTIPPGFTGFLVFHFDSAAKARETLGRMRDAGGPGAADLDFATAEIVAQPTGARLIIPYRMAGPSEP